MADYKAVWDSWYAKRYRWINSTTASPSRKALASQRAWFNGLKRAEFTPDKYEVIHIMDVSPEANLRRAVRVLAELHINDDGRVGYVARTAIELANQIDRDMLKAANGR